MTTMISEVYEAFLSVGVKHEVAQKAAQALSSESLATKFDISTLDKKIDTSFATLDKKIDTSFATLDKKIDTSFATLDKKIDMISVNLDKKIDTVNINLDKKIDSVKYDISKEIQTLKTEAVVVRWMLGFVGAGVASLVIKAFF